MKLQRGQLALDGCGRSIAVAHRCVGVSKTSRSLRMRGCSASFIMMISRSMTDLRATRQLVTRAHPAGACSPVLAVSLRLGDALDRRELARARVSCDPDPAAGALPDPLAHAPRPHDPGLDTLGHLRLLRARAPVLAAFERVEPGRVGPPPPLVRPRLRFVSRASAVHGRNWGLHDQGCEGRGNQLRRHSDRAALRAGRSGDPHILRRPVVSGGLPSLRSMLWCSVHAGETD